MEIRLEDIRHQTEEYTGRLRWAWSAEVQQLVLQQQVSVTKHNGFGPYEHFQEWRDVPIEDEE